MAHDRSDPPGVHLAALRKSRGWSLRQAEAEAAKRGINLPYSTIRACEINRGYTQHTLELLAQLYKVKVWQLFLPPDLAAFFLLPASLRERVLDLVRETVAHYGD